MVQVRILNPTDLALRLFGDASGRVYLDTPRDFELRLSKALDRISELSQVSQEAALGESVFATAKNRAIFASFGGDNVDLTPVAIKVQAEVDGWPRLVGELDVVSFDERASPPVYEIDMAADDWIDDLKRTLVRDVDLGTFTWSVANIDATWSGDRQQLVQPLLADFGGWLSDSAEVLRRDLRLGFNLWLLMKEVLCSIGWDLQWDHYSVGDGSNVYGYFGGENWYSYSSKEAENFAELSIPGPLASPSGIDFDVVSDPDGGYDTLLRPGEWLYGFLNDGPIDLRIQIIDWEIVLDQSPANEPVYSFFILTYKNDNGETRFIDFRTFQGSTERDVVLNLNFEILDEDMTQGDSYQFVLGYEDLSPSGNSGSFTVNSGTVIFRPDPPFYEDDGDVILSETIDPELTGFALFENMIKLMNGKFITDLAAKRIIVYPPESYPSTADPDTIIPGFYLKNKNPVDLRNQTHRDGYSWTNNRTDRNRYLVFKFDDGDAYVDQRQAQSNFDRRIDLGSGIAEEEEFEVDFVATIDKLVALEEIGGTGVVMPVIWDNTANEKQFEWSPRALVFYGNIDQPGSGGSRTWSFEGIIKNLVPHFSQVSSEVLPIGVPLQPVSFSGYRNDIFNSFYLIDTNRRSEGVEYFFEVSGGSDSYESIDFRRLVLVTGRDTNWQVIPLSVQDHLSGSLGNFTVRAWLNKC